MRREHQDLRAREKPHEPVLRPLLKVRIADREPFIHQDDVGIHRGRNGEPQPHVHPAGIRPHRHRKKVAQLREFGDIVEQPVGLAPGKAQENAAHPDILDAARFPFHAQVQVDQRGHAARDVQTAGDRPVDAGESPQQGGLAGPVMAP